MPKVCDLDDGDAFADWLTAAEGNARTGWEMDFLSDMTERFEQWGDQMFLSPKQEAILKRIAKVDD